MDLKDLQIDKQWTLFLDRDGVINKKLDDDYVKNIEEFSFIKGSKEAIAVFNLLFGRIVVVTNQQGIGKGLMSKQDLKEVHDYMELELVKAGAHLDKNFGQVLLLSAFTPYVCESPIAKIFT